MSDYRYIKIDDTLVELRKQLDDCAHQFMGSIVRDEDTNVWGFIPDLDSVDFYDANMVAAIGEGMRRLQRGDWSMITAGLEVKSQLYECKPNGGELRTFDVRVWSEKDKCESLGEFYPAEVGNFEAMISDPTINDYVFVPKSGYGLWPLEMRAVLKLLSMLNGALETSWIWTDGASVVAWRGTNGLELV